MNPTVGYGHISVGSDEYTVLYSRNGDIYDIIKQSREELGNTGLF